MGAQTWAAGFDFQEEGDQESILSLVTTAGNGTFGLFYTIRLGSLLNAAAGLVILLLL